MGFDLPRLARAQGRRRSLALRAINPTKAQAQDLAAIMAPAWQLWTQSIDRIMAGYDPRPIGDALIVDTADQIQAAISEVASDFLTRVLVTVTPQLRRWSIRLEQYHRSRWAGAVLAGTGVDLGTVLTSSGTEETVSAFVARNVALVKNVSDQAQGRIADAVFRGYQERLPARDVAREIREAVVMGRDRTIRIASHQTSSLSGALDRERRSEAGLSQYKYRHSGKLHPRSWHKARDGFIYESATGKSLNGGPAIPADDRAGMAPACGCREQAWIPLADEIK